jgi:hypothetical protein
VKGFARRVFLSELHEYFAQASERVLVLGIENQGFLERTSSPSVFLARKTSVANADVQLYRMWIERESLAKYVERLIVLPLIVQSMSSFVVLLRTQEWSRHLSNSLPCERAKLLYNL